MNASTEMPMGRTLRVLCVVGVLCGEVVFVAGCGGQGYAGDDSSKTRVGIVFDIGGKDDRSFNAAAWRGVHCAETGKWPDGTDFPSRS